ncbi:hypothetical protein LTR85_009642 [Meristemomyces frigidus]|nr:hypothetical protein LTR85_009642 [Meristemomyces frigidus]
MARPDWRSRAPLGYGRPLADIDHGDEPPRKKRAETMTKLDHQRETSRIIFNKTISGRYREGEAGFEAVGVLLITWKDDDLFCRQSEVPRLRDIFKDRFGYDVREYQIPSERSATGLARALANFAYEFDSPNKMAICYYGGHGQFVKDRLQLFAKEAGDGDGDPAAFFDDAIHQLKLPDTDILVIVDCCFAARAFGRTEIGRRKFELLTATPPLEQTPSPRHSGSFTNLLCNAFDDLLETDNRGFTTAKLYRHVFFAQEADERKPFLFDQSSFDYGKIWLKPFWNRLSPANVAGSSAALAAAAVKERHYYVDLRLQMSVMPDQLMMNQLATSMQYLPHVKELRFQHLHAPEAELEEFMNGIRKAAVLRPLIVKLRHRRAMRELQERRQEEAPNESPSKTPESTSTSHPSMHTKPADRTMYDWSASYRETAHAVRPADTPIDAPDDIDAGDTVHEPT